jgi:hypothetical protein
VNPPFYGSAPGCQLRAGAKAPSCKPQLQARRSAARPRGSSFQARTIAASRLEAARTCRGGHSRHQRPRAAAQSPRSDGHAARR